MLRHTLGRVVCGAALLAALLGSGSCAAPPQRTRPNILWIVWDTVRADHLGLYGHTRDTTPFLDEWAAGARVFDDALSAAGYTLPSHASMFTGLFPSEHCTHNGAPRLADDYVTIAELLDRAGYRTYAFSANPHVSAAGNLVQGFGTVEHPWSAGLHTEAVAILREKLPEEDASSEFGERLRAFDRGELPLTAWHVKAAGKLAQGALLRWLEAAGDARPYFAFLNYMEAHRPYLPPRRYRERMMAPDLVARSYDVDRSWIPMWEYTFGLREYDAEELELTRATYDAAIAELDDHLRELIGSLEQRGHLDDTIVIVTSDHGEHLGERHMLDHQYSLYQPLLRVPLVVRYPAAFAAGREPAPVMNLDLFPTLLELTGVAPPPGPPSRAVSLLHPEAGRARLAEEPSSSELGVRMVLERHPGWDPTRWLRQLRSLVVGRDKLIRASDGERELFDLAADPFEANDLEPERPQLADSLEAALERVHGSLRHCTPQRSADVPLTPEQVELLRDLGYVR